MLECGHRCFPQLSVAMAMLVGASSTPQAWASSSPAASAALTPLRRSGGCVLGRVEAVTVQWFNRAAVRRAAAVTAVVASGVGSSEAGVAPSSSSWPVASQVATV